MALRLKEDDLKCKKCFEYYGNVLWGGYCSQCHKLISAKAAMNAETKVLTSVSQHKRTERLVLILI